MNISDEDLLIFLTEENFEFFSPFFRYFYAKTYEPSRDLKKIL